MPVGRMTRRGALPTVLLSAVALVGTGNTPAAADSGVSLPISSASDIVVDSVYQHLFISDPADSSVLVTDYAGSVVTEIPSQSGAAGLAMDEDFVYVALPSANAISLINRSTLQETTRRSTGIGIAPQHLAFAAGKLWFGYDTSLQGRFPRPRRLVYGAQPGREPFVEVGTDPRVVFGCARDAGGRSHRTEPDRSAGLRRLVRHRGVDGIRLGPRQ
ncbi:YncE family protein [Streptomyces sp. NPDC004096]